MSLKENSIPANQVSEDCSDDATQAADGSGLDYVISEVSILSWGASTQRAGIYAAYPKGKMLDKSLKLRSEFKSRIFKQLDDVVIPKYGTEVSEKEHIQNIKSLSEFGTKVGRELTGKLGAAFLRAEGYKIGIAQKLLNLHLKYLWCLGQIPEPPHCPVDALILKKSKEPKAVLAELTPWTKINLIEEYMATIEVLRIEADKENQRLATWELAKYERR